ncbi:MAG: hypothetical protein LWX01_12100 [Deltaproteobacteria bacterium]|nr:hypothetical protein [Deltaproteobacteria bacterium]
MDKLNFNEIDIEALARGKESHQFEELSGRIIGAAIEVHVISQSSGSKGGLIAEFYKTHSGDKAGYQLI